MKRFKLFLLIAGICFSLGFLWGLRQSVPPATPETELSKPTLKEALLGPAVSKSTLPAAGRTPNQLSGETAAQLKLLDEILASRNDNDPRLDRDLRILSEETKEALRQKYTQTALEKRNDRGTIVFLLSRNLTTDADYAFFCEVLRERPCYSLANCQGDAATSGKENFEHESGEEVTLAYPQMVALSGLQKMLGKTALASKTIDCAKDSHVGIVQQKAIELTAP